MDEVGSLIAAAFFELELSAGRLPALLWLSPSPSSSSSSSEWITRFFALLVAFAGSFFGGSTFLTSA
jgi:hypothetical protein